MPLLGPPGHVIRDEGVNLAQAPYLDFVGSGVSVATAAGVTTATISTGASSPQDASTIIAQRVFN